MHFYENTNEVCFCSIKINPNKERKSKNHKKYKVHKGHQGAVRNSSANKEIELEAIRFSLRSKPFIEFSEFRDSEKSLKQELSSIQGSSILPVYSGIISVSYTW